MTLHNHLSLYTLSIGDYRPQDLTKPPFSLPPPIRYWCATGRARTQCDCDAAHHTRVHMHMHMHMPVRSMTSVEPSA